jgi:hypothetical protein
VINEKDGIEYWLNMLQQIADFLRRYARDEASKGQDIESLRNKLKTRGLWLSVIIGDKPREDTGGIYIELKKDDQKATQTADERRIEAEARAAAELSKNKPAESPLKQELKAQLQAVQDAIAKNNLDKAFSLMMDGVAVRTATKEAIEKEKERLKNTAEAETHGVWQPVRPATKEAIEKEKERLKNTAKKDDCNCDRKQEERIASVNRLGEELTQEINEIRKAINRINRHIEAIDAIAKMMEVK